MGLALIAARRGYHCVFVMPDKMSPEKMDLLRAYGAEVVVCPTAVAPDHPDSYYSVAKRIAAERPGGYSPSQYWNHENPAAHERTTGPELWRQTAGRITHFVAGIGTGGTISGVGRYLKAQNPDIRIVGADPAGSVYSGGTGRPYLVEGIGEDFWPGTYDGSVVDEIVEVSDRDSFLMARAVTRTEGLLVGGSTGTAVWAALQVGRALPPDAVVVVLIPDSGRGYLSKIYNEDWMADFGFLRVGEHAAGDVLGRKRADLPVLVHVHPDETVRTAIEILREYDVSQLPVVQAEPPVVLGEMVGAVRDVALMDAAFRDPGVLDRPVADVMEAKLPTVGVRPGGGRRGGPARAGPGRRRHRRRSPRRRPHPLRRARLHRRLPDPPVTDAERPPGFETRAIHAGQDPDPATGAVVPPIHLATTFAQHEPGKAEYEYSRSNNPTREVLEDAPRRPSKEPATASPSPAAWRPRTPSCARCGRATT